MTLKEGDLIKLLKCTCGASKLEIGGKYLVKTPKNNSVWDHYIGDYERVLHYCICYDGWQLCPELAIDPGKDPDWMSATTFSNNPGLTYPALSAQSLKVAFDLLSPPPFNSLPNKTMGSSELTTMEKLDELDRQEPEKTYRKLNLIDRYTGEVTGNGLQFIAKVLMKDKESPIFKAATAILKADEKKKV